MKPEAEVGGSTRGGLRPPGECQGFVLLEALVALAILGVAAIALLQVRAQQMRVAAQARELLAAQALAEDRVAALRVLNYETLSDPPDSLLRGTFPEPFGAFSWEAEVVLMEDEQDLFGIEVVVMGPSQRFPLRTLLHRPRLVAASAGGPMTGIWGGEEGPMVRWGQLGGWGGMPWGGGGMGRGRGMGEGMGRGGMGMGGGGGRGQGGVGVGGGIGGGQAGQPPGGTAGSGGPQRPPGGRPGGEEG